MKQLLTLLLIITALSCKEENKRLQQPVKQHTINTKIRKHGSNIVIINGDTLLNSDTANNVHVSINGNDVTVTQNDEGN
jgi:hypothetical protein